MRYADRDRDEEIMARSGADELIEQPLRGRSRAALAHFAITTGRGRKRGSVEAVVVARYDAREDGEERARGERRSDAEGTDGPRRVEYDGHQHTVYGLVAVFHLLCCVGLWGVSSGGWLVLPPRKTYYVSGRFERACLVHVISGRHSLVSNADMSSAS
jgi:hypothetical protein